MDQGNVGSVLIHGGAFTGQCWHRLVPSLIGKVIAPDLPGRASVPFEHAHLTFDICAQRIFREMDEAGLEKAHLVGHSLGGATLLAVARARPDRIASLTFLAAPVPDEGNTVLSAISAESREFICRTAANGKFSLDIPSLPGELGDAAAKIGAAEAVSLFFEPVSLSGLKTVEHVSYVKLTDDASLPPDLQDRSILQLRSYGPCHVIELAADHMVMLSCPGELAGILNAHVLN